MLPQEARAQLQGSALSAAKEEAATASREAAAKLTTLLGERDVALVKAAAAERRVAESQRDLESAQASEIVILNHKNKAQCGETQIKLAFRYQNTCVMHL